MDRISRSVMLMQMAQVVAQRGTCSRLQVGAVVSKDGRILTMGYNGAPAGLPHCRHDCDCGSTDKYGDVILPHGSDCSSLGGCQIAEHAERNAIAWAAREGVALKGSSMHCTHAPCVDCARSIINAGIECVTYVVPYRLTAGVELLELAGIQVIAMSDASVI